MLDMEQQYDNIYRYCYFKLRHAQTAEDITQETFLRYWDRYHPMPNALAIRYLYIIAKNLCIDEYRRQNSVP
ncbi:MAG: RNA polymerase subunit sigma-24, partial [Oscillospiraceae bacterium]|nr:RNA polymerase subunit sigma-24 [Oscillospiraceae bacterium]